ncbi:MAG TPA: aminotransferase class V-fold PLP-dependent enzyme [Gemmatimonadaceae bacterium]|nr:aminotransferase class V-fold PLP-dependent enzyme [Gemmatimonadaceae bacterium]
MKTTAKQATEQTAAMRIETLAVHAGSAVDPATGAVMMPIHLSTTFERDPLAATPPRYIYTRENNPNREALEQCLAALERGAAALAFSSGSAATMAILQTLRPGDHVLVPNDAYYGTIRLLRDILGPWGLEHTPVDATDAAALERAIRPSTRLVWLETPSNPLVRVTDIARIAELAHAAGALVACDNTWATPMATRPIELGADLVMHSTTKYLGGHSDVLGGAVVVREPGELLDRLRAVQRAGGAVPSPFECWLTLRGIRTLPWRMRAHTENALRVSRFLSGHPAVEAIHYPGLPSHAGHEVAARQMTLFGGMASVQVRGGRDEALGVASRVRLFTHATSLGGPESLIEHRASVEGPETRTPQNLLRMSIGLEHADDLIADLDQALAPLAR